MRIFISHAIADEDLPRENDEKTSAVHFLRFELSDTMIAAIKNGEAIAIGVDLAAYNHRVDEIVAQTHELLSQDFA